MSQQNLHPQAQALADFLRQQPLDQEELLQAITEFTATSSYDPNDDILLGWGIDDVQQAVEYIAERRTVSVADAVLVLEKAADQYDASIGMNWEVLQMHLIELKDSGQIKFKRIRQQFRLKSQRKRQALRQSLRTNLPN
ncbi:MAG: hypothetical protein KME07_09255 [Pegethrix bostrychoides GSE-TBD4-15B]|uniref:Uncharacterized protein n=1 Tax=Pegethrix bostrychoides GSE-TBD4-15B TaxID=2839662 RepID=A0A951PA76_9CYAN|nr:hypothetical protein [Pegethrix bostrychoides GSE-TBD4-15B]